MKLYLMTTVIVFIVCSVLYAGCRFVVSFVEDRIETNRKINYEKGYNAGRKKGYSDGLQEGRADGMKLAKILDINARATINDIRVAYGFAPDEYLENLRESGVISLKEYEESKRKVSGSYEG